MADMVKKKRGRAGIIGYINRILKGEIAAIYDDYKEDNLLALISLQTVIEDKLKYIVKLSEEIQQSMDEEGEFQTDFDKYTDVEISIRRDLTYLSNFIEGKQTKKVTPSPRGVRASSRINLPKFEIKKFSGDPTCWKSFIKSFDAAVHSTMELTDIEKMNVLVNHSDICLPAEEQRINLAKREYLHLRHLPFADNNPNDLPLQIDLLNGRSRRIGTSCCFVKFRVYFEWFC